ITLNQGTTTFDFIYIAVTQRGMVAQLNTETGAVNWIRPSHGGHPSRTAVAFDGSVWVGNRGFGDTFNINVSNLVHLDVNGELICRAQGVTGLIRGVAIDADGNVWAGAWDGQRVFKVSGTEVDRSTSPPSCRLLATYNVGVNVYGLAVDPDGWVWTASSPTTVRINTRTGEIQRISNPSFYGIAADGAGRMWLGGYIGSGPLHAIIRSTGAIVNVPNDRDPPMGIRDRITAVTVHPDGTVWGTAYGANRIYAWDPSTNRVRCNIPIPPSSGNNPHGIAVDRRGRVWAPNRYGGYVNVYDPATCRAIATYPVDPGQELYSYSDMTGHLLRTFTAPRGQWRQVFDSGYENAYWTRVSWHADTPPDTGVEIEVRSSRDGMNFPDSTRCGPYTASPADLTACPSLGRARYIRVDATLTSRRSGVRPILYRIDASWAY
ncbi:MAG: hypothetical protein NZM37_11590, partial [Sandaracinaceae bacterium]|nr:hypothetical protein [Sandaracinaceae bacterium]